MNRLGRISGSCSAHRYCGVAQPSMSPPMPAARVSRMCRCDGENDARALAEIQAEMVAQGLMKAPSDHAMASKGRAKAARAAKRPRSDGGGGDGGRRASPGGTSSPFRQFTSPSGLQILVGRNNVQNDELSTRVANRARPYGPPHLSECLDPFAPSLLRVRPPARSSRA